jgi:putative tricarboxylic transport membrane protein
VPGQQVGPNVFPLVVGLGLAVCGALIALGIGRSFEEEVRGAGADAEIGAGERPSRWRGLKALIPPGLLIFYVLAVDRLGFWITAAIIVCTAAIALGARMRVAAPLAVLAPLAVHLLFLKLLRVPLPAGLLAPPW